MVPKSKGRIFVNWITSTDHKTIGYMYLIAAFISSAWAAPWRC
ncbi:cytochrome C oxidase polypeptide I [Rothia aeria]|uniref:Cytochrome C oxidase polypeptide I n=1 Tax=Rothia aeria TaxID=172042 RepID=A0A2Z5R0F1_9MICC|nr:cytochrome C oxidase polypeptide I [Rothia aeria]